MKIEIISGSPRSNSVTHRLALHLQQVLQESTTHEVGVIALKDNIFPPLQSVITSADAAPAELREVATCMFAAEAYIIVTPEYNGSYSPAMQNLFDHFPKQHHKPFGLVTASPGALGGIRAAMQLQQFVMALFGLPSPYMLVTPQVDKKFDSEGALIDPSFEKSVETFTREFLWLAEKVVEEKVTA
jgi:NAD(P)H-dependent FMN reductase